MAWRCVPRAAYGETAWDEFAAACPDAWLWHTTRFLRLVSEDGRFGTVADRSFAVVDGQDTVALVPFPVTAHRDWRGETVRETLCTGWSAPMPAVRAGLSREERAAAFAFCAAAIDAAARTNALQRTVFFVAAQQELLYAECRAQHPFSPFAWQDVSEVEQGIDLTAGLAAVEAGYRKRFARYLRAIRERVATTVVEQDAAVVMAEYAHLMDEDSVMQPHRSACNARFIADMLAAGTAFAVRATLDGTLAGILVVMLAKGQAFDYAVTIADRCRSMRIGHALKAAAVRHLAAQGARLYDLGIATFGPTAQRVPNAKQFGITEFKGNIANCRLPLYIVEKFHDDGYAAALRARRRQRLEAYLAEQSG